MQVYGLVINEAQRLMLTEGLHMYVNMQGNKILKEEAKLLEDMFIALPEVEKKSPGINHGLCY